MEEWEKPEVNRHHLHFAGRPLIKIDGGFRQLFPINGFRGYIDIEPMITQHYLGFKRISEDFNIRNYMATNEKKIIIRVRVRAKGNN